MLLFLSFSEKKQPWRILSFFPRVLFKYMVLMSTWLVFPLAGILTSSYGKKLKLGPVIGRGDDS